MAFTRTAPSPAGEPIEPQFPSFRAKRGNATLLALKIGRS